MSESLDFGIISQFDSDKNYSHFSEPFESLYAKYHCVSVADDDVNQWISLTSHIPTFGGCAQMPSHGINHYGITIIPPSSISLLLELLLSQQNSSIDALVLLLRDALQQNFHVICFGI